MDFRRTFRDVFDGQLEIPVFVNADSKVPYGMVIRVISEIQNADVIKLGFLTLPLERSGR